jgi:2,4-dienoyl-CoA reductase-like NADH-dependent reductase (Old Yellow Enzyme family)
MPPGGSFDNRVRLCLDVVDAVPRERRRAIETGRAGQSWK